MDISPFDKKIINQFQRGFPICPKPYKKVAEVLQCSEQEVLDSLQRLKSQGTLARVGPVFAPNKVGASCLAAMRLGKDELEEVATQISQLKFVNHNYERENEFNLWFVVTGKDQEELELNLRHIKELTLKELLVLPLEKEFFIDLGFEIK